jgi:MFS family permease
VSEGQLAALILASALISLDGTAVTVTLPAIARDLSMPFSRVQWIGNAPLLMLAALLLPAGVLADRLGRTRVMRHGLVAFCVGSVAAAAAPDDLVLIGARLLQGAGGALVLPGAVAELRASSSSVTKRTRRFGLWAAATGLASAAGPLLGGGLADVFSWRATFVVSAGLAALAFLLLRRAREEPRAAEAPLPAREAAALVLFLGALAYVLIEGPVGGWTSARVLAAAAVLPSTAVLLLRSSRRHVLVPPEMLRTHNCIPANGATFALYFGLFGLTFLLVLYTQQALGYSGIWAGAGVLPISLMLLLAEPFGRLAPRLGARTPIVAGSALAALGILWVAAGDHPLPFWSRIVVGTCLFGLGVSLSASALTQAAVAAVPEHFAGVASGFNHATVRAAGLLAIAVLGAIAADGDGRGVSATGFQQALIACGGLVAVIGIFSALRIRNDAPGGLPVKPAANPAARS